MDKNLKMGPRADEKFEKYPGNPKLTMTSQFSKKS